MSEPNEPRRSHVDGRPLVKAVAFAVIYVVWGSTYLGIRLAVETIPPFLMAGARYGLAGAVLYALLRARGVKAPSLAEWRHAFVAGLLMLTAGNGLVTWAEKYVPSNLAALLVAAVPLHVALLEWLRPTGRRPGGEVLGGVVLGFAGMVLLVSPGGAPLVAGEAPSTLAIVAVLIAGLAWAIGSLYARYAPRSSNPLMPAAQQMIAGGCGLLIAAFARGDLARVSAEVITGTSALAFLYLTVFGSLVAFSAFGYLVQVATPAQLSTTAFVNPVVAVILGWSLLGERLGPRALAGAALIVLAVMMMTFGNRWLLGRRVGTQKAI